MCKEEEEEEEEPDTCDPPPSAGTTCSECHHDSTAHNVFDIDGNKLGNDRNHVHMEKKQRWKW